MADRWKEEQESMDRRFGRICAVIAEVNRNNKARQKPFTEEDFIPKKPQSVEEQKAILMGIGE